ncbi:MAG: sensor histidine kinase [Allosphingosinicella sp.]|uniref:sensor histidine kinase n=1 Tax=Allosphingosinicella sp. TaxID=2823234 RepID=UPI003944EFF1
MKRLMPESLIGQIALLMGAALLFAQAVNFALILTERQRLSLAQIEGPAIGRFVTFAQDVAAAPTAERAALAGERRRRSRYSIGPEPLVAAGAGDRRLEDRLRAAAAEAGLPILDARAAVSDEVPRFGRGKNRPPDSRMRRELQTLMLSVQLQDRSWLNARMVTPRRDPWLAARLAGATLLLYLIVLGAMVMIAARLARPLRDLASAADRFEGRGDAPQVEPRGPADLQRAIESFNAMNARVTAMLDEKDRMLGAIGHDLRTPLASLRIRAESMEPEEERQKMIATIEEMTAMLDDTLVLARSGRAREPARAIDVSALVDALVEEYRELGQDVELASGGRQVACVRPNLLRRAVRNLIDNAVKYAGSARVAVGASADRVIVDVTDSGPGIPEAALASVQEPFQRLEASRNRETGGSGLGLTIARAVALNHGGELRLENRPEGGLSARLFLPKA